MFNRLLYVAAFIFILMQLRAGAAGDSIVVYIKSSALSEADFRTLYQTHHYDSDRVALVLRSNVYLAKDQNCGRDIPVFQSLTHSLDQIEKSLQKGNSFNSLLAYTATLYKLIPEPFKMSNFFPATSKETDYPHHALGYPGIFDSLSTGAWAFACGGHAEMAKVFLDSLGGNKYISKTAQLSRKNGDVVNHIVTLVYYREHNIWYGIAIDCQNGKLGPIRNGTDSILSIKEQRNMLGLNQADSLELASISEEDLHKKRNLMNDAFYCNLLPDTSCVYRMAYPQSGYKYERLTYSTLHYAWFKTGAINLKNYKQNLLTLLIKNVPEN
jgi:hypothetical protein